MRACQNDHIVRNALDHGLEAAKVVVELPLTGRQHWLEDERLPAISVAWRRRWRRTVTITVEVQLGTALTADASMAMRRDRALERCESLPVCDTDKGIAKTPHARRDDDHTVDAVDPHSDDRSA